MISVRYHRMCEVDTRETWLDGSVRTVPAATYADLDGGQGGIVRADIGTDDIRTLADFGPGDEIFVESEDPTDCLDDTDVATEIESHIWWQAVIVAG